MVSALYGDSHDPCEWLPLNDMPDWACELCEVAENLCRKELIPNERAAHTTMYTGLLKLHGAVVAMAGRRRHKHKRRELDPSHLGLALPPSPARSRLICAPPVWWHS